MGEEDTLPVGAAKMIGYGLELQVAIFLRLGTKPAKRKEN